MENFKNILKNKGMSQKEAAEMLGLTESAISKYISGERSPRPDIIYNILNKFDVSYEELFLENTNKKKSTFDKIMTMITTQGTKLNCNEIKKIEEALNEISNKKKQFI